MPIGKNSIQRAAKTGAAAKSAPNTVKKATHASPKKATTDSATNTNVTEHVIANISPEVVEKMIEKKPNVLPQKDKVAILQPLPDYLL